MCPSTPSSNELVWPLLEKSQSLLG
ncbi:hypothetical protein THAOC_37646, partial [Thalassiosira oceanica]